MKILITGGHMGPALAVIAALPRSTEIVYVGRKYSFEGDLGYSLEYQTISKMGITFIPITTGRLQRVITPHTLTSLLKVPWGIVDALRILQKESPDVVVGFGGYVSLPVGFAAKLLHIPLFIHEQTLHVGMANKILARVATQIGVGWEETFSYFPKDKTVITGNPLLPFTKDREVVLPKGHLPLLAIVGGSGGSHAINMLVEKSLPTLLSQWRIIHQTGDATEFGDFQKLQKVKEQLPKELQDRYEIVKFIPPGDVWTVLEKSDGVVGRSGINTATMLFVLGKKALLIPLPYGQKKEQYANALLLEKMGLGTILDQKLATPSSFVSAITAMMEMKPQDGEKMKTYATLHLHAAEKIAEMIQLCAQTASQKEKIK